MKKILFVMPSLRIGGAEKSLVTLLSELDPEEYDISLFLFQKKGEFLEYVPDYVRLLPEDPDIVTQDRFRRAPLMFLAGGKPRKALYSLCWLAGCAVSRFIKREPEYIGWKWLRRIYGRFPDDGEYDMAVAYLEKQATYYTVDFVRARKKIAFMHTDYGAIPHDEKTDAEYYKKIDKIYAVSESAKEKLVAYFPDMRDKCFVRKNSISEEVIQKMSKEGAPEFDNVDGILKIATVGRLTAPKNIDGAIEIMYEIHKRGTDALWVVVGEGEERPVLEKMIREKGLEDCFLLVGAKANPYPYMAKCDIYVQPSRWEGYGITVAEAMALGKKIICSDLPEFRELIESYSDGNVCVNGQEIVECIEKLAKNMK